MLALKIQMMNGMVYDDEFEDVSEFIRLMMDDFPPMDDKDVILEVVRDGEKYDFSGTANELYEHWMNEN